MQFNDFKFFSMHTKKRNETMTASKTKYMPGDFRMFDFRILAYL